MIEGLGLFYGETGTGFAHRRIYTAATWDQACRQSADWGITWLHPKVADGGNWWYDSAGLGMLRDVAHHYGLKVAPYHYCYGNMFGYLLGEADIAATIANIFDGCCPDIEVEWNGQAQWAIDFGKEVRKKSPHGLFVPTLYADPHTISGGNLAHTTPYAQLSSWMDAWMPMVYFSEWTSGGHQDSAQNAIDFVYPQWVELNQHIHASGFTPKPILPLIELGSALPPQEVYNWLRLMGHYGYCGFWYDGTYSPYASAIKSAPRPAFPHSAPQPTPTQVMPPQPYTPAPLKGPGLADEQGDPTMNQNLTTSQLAVLWHMSPTSMALNLNNGIPRLWAALVQKHPDWHLGGPRTDGELPFHIGNEQGVYVDFYGGVRIINFNDGTLCVSATPEENVPLGHPGAIASTLAALSAPSQPTMVEVPAVTVTNGAAQ